MANSASQEPMFLTINHQASWEEGLLANIQASEQGIQLLKDSEYRLDRTLTLSEIQAEWRPTDIAPGPCHMLFLLDENSQVICTYDPEQNLLEPLDWMRSLFESARRIAYSPRKIYVLDQHEQGSSIVQIAEVNGQWVWNTPLNYGEEESYPERLRLQPMHLSEMATTPFGDVYALDRVQKCVLYFTIDGKIASVFGTSELKGDEATGIAVSADGLVFVLQSSLWKVIVFSEYVKVREFDLHGPESPSCIAMDSEGILYIGDRGTGADGEEDRYIHLYDQDGRKLGMEPAYRGSAQKIVINHQNTMFILNTHLNTLSILKRERALLKRAGSPLADGYYFSKSFDSTSPYTTWHELRVEADIPGNSQIEVSYLVASDKAFSILGPRVELDDYLKDPSIPQMRKIEVLNQLDWSLPMLSPKDALIPNSSGRYLWLRIRLIGSEGVSPVVRSVRAVFPRASYLRYLPAIYQEDEVSRSFLERYLSLFERFLSDSETAIDQIAKWFDADAVTGEYLRWLASWLAIAYDENWPEERLRHLIHRVPELYRKRGTREGLESMIELFTGQKPFIMEHFQLEAAEDAEVIELLHRLYGNDPYGFCVLLKPQVMSSDNYAAIRRIVEEEKPAHTTAGITALQPWIYLDHHSYLEVNSILTRPSSRLGDGVIQRDSVLSDRDFPGHIRSKARAGMDTVLS